ncbi:MAG: hypothetical protein RL885_11785 [Planctomycetota bacterium]
MNSRQSIFSSQLLAGTGLAIAVWLFIPGELAHRPRPNLAEGRSNSISPAPRELDFLAPAGAPMTDPRAASLLGRLPLAFVENIGQWDEGLRFVARGSSMLVGLKADGFKIGLRQSTSDPSACELPADALPGLGKLDPSAADSAPRQVDGLSIDLTFEGANARVTPLPEGELPGRYNFFIGNDSNRWRSGALGYALVRYRGLYDGIDVVFREGEGAVHYDLACAPGADLDQVVIRCEGIKDLVVDEQGALVLETRLGPLVQPPPISWYELPSGERAPLEVTYRRIDEKTYGFAAERTRDLAMVVDPGLVWSTSLGGNYGAWPRAIGCDEQGAPTVSGLTASWDFPTTDGAYDELRGSTYADDAFVTRLTADGSALVYSTYLGGTRDDVVYRLALADSGSAVLVGLTQSTEFPTTPGAFQTNYTTNGAAFFLTRLGPRGDRLEYSTFLNDILIHDVALAPDESPILAGYSWGFSPITPGAFDTTPNGSSDCYLAILDPTGSRLLYATYFGGTDTDAFSSVALTDAGEIVLCGGTLSSDFPVTAGAFDTTFNGPSNSVDVFIAKFDLRLSSPLLFSTFVGGAKNENASRIKTDPSGAITVAGFTYSSDYPVTPGAFDRHFDGDHVLADVFVTRLTPQGNALVYSTFLGGAYHEMTQDFSVDRWGTVTVTGTTTSSDFPTTQDAFQPFPAGGPGVAGGDAFVTRLNPLGTGLIYSTYLGGTWAYWYGDFAWCIAADRTGRVIVGGITDADDFPTTPGAFDTVNNGGFVTKIQPGPFLSTTGTPTAGGLFRFNLSSAAAPIAGALAQVVVSCSGTGSLPLPGGLELPLTSDACTAMSLRLGSRLQASIDPSTGKGSTPAQVFPPLSRGQTIYAAAFTWDPALGEVISVTPPIAIRVQ